VRGVRATAALVLALALLAAALVQAASLDPAKVVDLTYAFGADTVYWPTEKGFRLEARAHGPTPGGFFYAANAFTAPEHGGTHLDAPLHFAERGLAADALPVAAGIGPAVVVDVSAQAATDRDYRLTPADLAAWEKAHGRIPERAIVLMRSGWGRFWPDRARYLGTAAAGDVDHLHFPAFSKEAAEWLLHERRPAAIGVDTASVDHGPSKDFPVHRVVAAADLPAFENVAHLDRLPPAGATIVALPMKIAGGTGAPLRIVAFLP
jgi:kynurenine formamidase